MLQGMVQGNTLEGQQAHVGTGRKAHRRKAHRQAENGAGDKGTCVIGTTALESGPGAPMVLQVAVSWDGKASSRLAGLRQAQGQAG